jgi:hypothetical protein
VAGVDLISPPARLVSARVGSPMLALLVSALLVIANWLSRSIYLNADWQQLSLLAIATSALSLWLVIAQFRHHVWAFSPMLLLLIVLLHVGLLLGPAFTGRFYLLKGASTAWIYTTETKEAIWYVSMCVASFALGANLVLLMHAEEKDTLLNDAGFGEAASKVGVVILVGSVIAWFGLVIRLLGTNLFRGSYLDFFEATHASAISYANLGISLGLVLVCLRPFGRRFVLGLLVFGVFAVVSMSIGSRSTAMFSAAAGAVVLAYMRKMPALRWIWLITAAVASLVGLIRLTRLGYVSGAGIETLLRAPATGFAELGYTVRVVQTSFIWHGVQGEPFMHGATYTGWLARIFDAYVLNTPLPPRDYRLMNVEIASRIGGLGGSILGEAHHNFGAFGGIAFLGAVGAATAWISRTAHTTLRVAVVGVVAAPMFIHVRNAFTPVIFAVLCGALAIQLARLFQRRRAS